MTTGVLQPPAARQGPGPIPQALIDALDGKLVALEGPAVGGKGIRNPQPQEPSLGRVAGELGRLLAILQGADDLYGTMRQVEIAHEECYCPVEVALLPDTRHAPHREAPEATLRAVADFCNRLFRDHHEGAIAAHAAEPLS